MAAVAAGTVNDMSLPETQVFNAENCRSVSHSVVMSPGWCNVKLACPDENSQPVGTVPEISDIAIRKTWPSRNSEILANIFKI